MYTPTKSFLPRWYVIVLIVFLIGSIFGLWFQTRPPYSFPEGAILTIRQGDTLETVADNLKNRRMIRSGLLFQDSVILLRGDHAIIAGDYYFEQPMSVFAIAKKLTTGTFELSDVRVTLPEGSTVEQMAEILGRELPGFDVQKFISLSQSKEGYLFPDTYQFMPNVKPEEVVQKLTATFEERITPLLPAIIAASSTLKEIVTLASILEEEAKTDKDWRIVSGIMWKRMEIGMPLQVDATLGYVTGRGSNQLTVADLRNESEYNTYTNLGLPPTPIANPGIKTLEAALYPEKTPYLYFLSDADDIIHYGRTLDEHNANRQKYLNK